MMGEHAKLSPSASSRWMMCAVAPRREAESPDTSSPSAEWGVAAHSVLERALVSGERATPQTANDIYYPLEEKVKKVEDLAEMVATVNACFEYVMSQKQACSPCDLRTESKVNPGAMVNTRDCWGTADSILVSHDTLEIIDFKSGAGIQREPWDSQLRLYALGALAEYGGKEAPFTVIKCTIVQPRGYHPKGPIRSFDYTISDLLDWCVDEFAPAVVRTNDPNAVATPSEEGCRFCKAKSTCSELSTWSLTAVKGVFGRLSQKTTQDNSIVSVQGDLADKLTREPGQLTPEEIRYILDSEKLITGWLSSVRSYAKEQGMAGNHIPGYKIVKGNKSKNWSNEDIIKKTTNMKNNDGIRLGKRALLEPDKTMSPAQAEKRIKPIVNKKTWEKIQAMIITSDGAPTLAPETDSRESYKVSLEQMFDPIDQQESTALPDLSFLD